MNDITRRSAIGGVVTIILAEEMGDTAHAKEALPPPTPTYTFPAPITAMTGIKPGQLAVACGADLYIVKVF